MCVCVCVCVCVSVCDSVCLIVSVGKQLNLAGMRGSELGTTTSNPNDQFFEQWQPGDLNVIIQK